MNRRKFFTAVAMVPAGTLLGHKAFAIERPPLYVIDANEDMPGGGHPLSSRAGWEITLDGVKVEDIVARLDERAGFIDVFVARDVPAGRWCTRTGHKTASGVISDHIVIERRYGMVRVIKFPDPRPITA